MAQRGGVSVFRPEQNALLIWNLEQARTAYVSGRELDALLQWTDGKDSGFIHRLKSLGLVCDADKEAVREKIALARTKTAPPNSFCAPESLHVELTGCCPLGCPSCYKSEARSMHLDFDVLREAVQQAAQMQVFQVALGGGEPLVYPDLAQVIQEIRKHGMAASITTSGHGLDVHVWEELMWFGLSHVQISLNGSREEINAKSRDGFEHALNALRMLSGIEALYGAKASYGVNWLARRDNIADFPDFLALAKGLGAQNVNILRYKPAEGEDYTKHCPTSDDLTHLASIIKKTRGIRLKTDSAFAGLLCHINKRTSFMSGCGAGRRFIALDAGGFYRPCSHVGLREPSGDLARTWFWSENLGMFRGLGDGIGEPCVECAYLRGCFGCRAVVMGKGGGF